MSSDFVNIIEVGPRDGLQNEKKILDTEQRINFVQDLVDCNIKTIEAGSFVSPHQIPQMQKTTPVIASLQEKNPNCQFPVLVPNLRGLNDAILAGAKYIAVFTTVSNLFSLKNTNCSVEQGLDRIKQINEIALKHNIKIRGYVSCVWGCPYEGQIPYTQTIPIIHKLFELGCSEISIGDTIGVATPSHATELANIVTQEFDKNNIALHFHDTYGQALANIYSCLELGYRNFDSSIAGLGGCPYAKGATGNVASEDVIYMIEGLGMECGINLEQLCYISHKFTSQYGFCNNSKVSKALVKA